jgi:hypothetical protein
MHRNNNIEVAIMKIKQVVGYARVSSREQAEDSQALQQQIARLKSAGATEIFQDIQSGSRDDRPALKQLINLVRKKEVDEVIITRIDRLARSLPKLRFTPIVPPNYLKLPQTYPKKFGTSIILIPLLMTMRLELPSFRLFSLEATPGFEPGVKVLQTLALPLGYVAGLTITNIITFLAQLHHLAENFFWDRSNTCPIVIQESGFNLTSSAKLPQRTK